MLIECILRRVGGTRVTMGNPPVNYHFKPADPTVEDSPHIADVSDPRHAKRFLEIKEAYKAGGKVDASVKKQLEEDEAAAKKAAEEQAALDGQNPDIIPVSEDTQIEITSELLALMKDLTKSDEDPVTNADHKLMTNKIVSAFFEQQTGVKPTSKRDLVRWAAGADIKIDDTKQPARIIRDLLNGLLNTFTTEEGEEGAEGDLGADADSEKHAADLTDTGAEDGEGDDDENANDEA